MRKDRWMLGVAAIVLALTAAGCGGKPAATGGNAAVNQLALTVGPGFTFNPGSITVKSGQPVELKVQNKDATLHDWSIEKIEVSGKKEKDDGGHDMKDMKGEPALHVSVQANGVGRLEFTPTRVGSYDFYCTVPGHKEAGMKGTLIVQ